MHLASQTTRALVGGSTVGRGEPGRSIRRGCIVALWIAEGGVRPLVVCAGGKPGEALLKAKELGGGSGCALPHRPPELPWHHFPFAA
jgi:hypothetical protein